MTTATQTLRTLIVDDELPARDLIATLLRADAGVEIVGQCANGRQAVAAIERHEPDLVFLDVQMPGLDGFGVLAETRPARMPHVVFVTAFDKHAIRAFEVHAIDYVLKPFEYDRIWQALQRVRERVAHEQETDFRTRVLRLLEDQNRRATTWDRIAVREHNRTLFLRPQEIDWAEADGNYVRLNVGAQSYLLRETMHALESRLTDAKFIRISRSTLVNLERVREWQPLFHGDAVLILHDGHRLTATRAYRDTLNATFARLR
jgi:two-component system LytT family response regulator